MNINQYIAGAAPDSWSLEKHSVEEGSLSFSWRVLAGAEDTHSEAVGDTAEGDDYSYTLGHVGRSYVAGGGYTVEQSWTDAVGALNEIPCFLRANLSADARARNLAAARWGLTSLVSCEDILEACAGAAAEAGITLDFSGVDAGDVMVPLIDNGSTIGSVLAELARHVPNMTTRVVGSTVTVCGGRGALTSTATYAKAVIECSPEMKAGTLTVGSTVVDLAAVYAANAGSPEPLNWYASHARLICDALAGCAEADAMQQGRYIFLTARVPGAAGNDITLTLSGVPAGGAAARAVVTPGEDLDAAGWISDGVNSVELEALGTFATGYLIYYVPGGQGFAVGGAEHYLTPPADEDVMSVEAWNAQLRAAGCPVECVSVEEATGDDEVQVNVRALVRGTAGNAITLDPDAGNAVSGRTLTGGDGGGRTLGDLVEAINEPDDPEVDFPFTAATEGTAASGSAVFNRAFTSARVTVSRGGTRLAQVTLSGFSSGAGGLATAINGNSTLAGLVHATSEGFTLTLAAAQSGAAANGTEVEVLAFSLPALTRTITLAGGSGGSGIVLTANEAGSAGNGIGVRASGCFGVAGQFSGGTDASGYDYGITPFSGGGGQDIRAAYDGLLGQRAREDLPTGWKIVRHTVDYDKGNEPPPCVVGVTSVGGLQHVAFVVPEGANPQQRGALVVDVDFARTLTPRVRESWEYDPERAAEVARAEIRRSIRGNNSTQEKTQPWMLVKGTPIPGGWEIAQGNVKMNTPHAKDAEKWQKFWAQFGACKILGKITKGIGFGAPYFFPIAALDAYPPEEAPAFVEDKAKLGKPLAPPVTETSNVPANYKVLGPGENVHLLVEGSFPASSKAGANIGGLKFCKGAFKQYVFITENPEGISREEALALFPGSYEYTVKDKDGNDKQRICRFTCLKVEGVFINRARKRFQQGTNKQAPGDPDYNEDKDGGAGWHILGDRTEDDPEPTQGLTKTDYIEAAKAYLAACGNAGTAGRTEEITAHVMDGDFDASLTVDDVFAALGMAPAASGGFSYDSSTREVTARGSAGQSAQLELDDFLTRRRAVKEAAWLDWKERHRDNSEMEPRERVDADEPPAVYPLTSSQVQDEKEAESYPMVTGGPSASSGVSSESMPLNPFQVYADGDTMYINEGELGTPSGPIFCEKRAIPEAKWKEGRKFYVKAAWDKTAHRYVARYKYYDPPEDDEQGNG